MSTTVFLGGTVLIDPSLDGEPIMSHALAIRGGIVVAVGDDASALGNETGVTVIDLEGGTLAPAVGDGHAHPLLGGVEALGPQIRQATNLAEILEIVATWRTHHPEDEWIVAGSYDATFAENGLFDARWLDEVTGDTPTVLRAWDYHTVWVNSAALAAANITAATEDPPLGRIVRRADGSPLGTLQEAAAHDFIANIAPVFSLEQRVHALDYATHLYAAQGTTWVQDAWVELDDVQVYVEAAKRKRLHTRVNLALRADPEHWREQVENFIQAREEIRRFADERLAAETIKFFVDGVIENHTASLVSPYADRPGEYGLPNWGRAELIAAVAAFDAAGFQVHLHAIGDAANRDTLDALENAIRVNPARDRHHVIAHVALLDPRDVTRFAELDVIANFQPYWAQCDAVMRDLTIPRLGNPRDQWQYLIGSVHRSGATVTFGSDWPVTTFDWRPALSTSIMRRGHADADGQPWLPHERIDAAAGFAAYTKGIARQALATQRGTLRPGMTADLAWLSMNPLTVSPENIPDIVVRGTWLSGEPTYLHQKM